MTIEIEVSKKECCSEVSTIVIGKDSEATKDMVKDTYRRAAERGGSAPAPGKNSGCGCGCSDEAANHTMMDESYEGIRGYVEGSDLGLGCGIPTDVAGIKEGDRVLDLGSGAGIDAFIAREIVGENGSVIGVDFTPEMITLAHKNAENLGLENVSFIEGDIEELPIPDDSVDVIVSNCVLNLVPDKDGAFREMVRVLAPGGHFCISDIVSRGHIPDSVRKSAEMYAGCVAGALDEKDYLRRLEDAGFKNVTVLKERKMVIPESALQAARVTEAQSEPRSDFAIVSITVRGEKR